MDRLLTALKFAAEKHTNQRRKNAAASPYINHPIEVAEHLSRVGGVTDENILIAALLHDTIEDTDTSEDEIRDAFGEQVLSLVLECTDDKSLEKGERKHLQVVNAPKKSSGARQIKIADKTCNLRSMIDDPPQGWSIARQLEYFNWAADVVAGLKGVNRPLDEDVDKVIIAGKQALMSQSD